MPPRGLTVGSLFAGIGGFDLGLERAGMRVAWQCERDAYCRRVLARHWPGIRCIPEVAEVGAGTVPWVDVLCGGFPCQDISDAGKRVGITGARSGLWREFARIIGELRPRYVLVENVPAITRRGLDRVLVDLAACGFDAEWDHLPAAAFGAPHRRDRLWLVAFADCARRAHDPQGETGCAVGDHDGRRHAAGDRGLSPGIMADADRAGSQGQRPEHGLRLGCAAAQTGGGGWWGVEPDVGRVADGIPHRVDRLRALGNALVPQIAQWIGERIVNGEATA
jgi:DNA (cytosine-5)-methyltransferase 1